LHAKQALHVLAQERPSSKNEKSAPKKKVKEHRGETRAKKSIRRFRQFGHAARPLEEKMGTEEYSQEKGNRKREKSKKELRD